MPTPVILGADDQSVTIRILDSTTFLPVTTVTAASAGLALIYRKGATGTVTAITEADLATAATAHADGGMIHLDTGHYRVDVPDAAVPTIEGEVTIVSGAVTGGIVLSAALVGVQPIGAPAGASIAADLAAIEAQTDDIGAAGAGLTALGDARLANLDAAVSTRATPAQVNTEADTALADAGVTSARMAYLTGPVATAAKLLSYFQSALRKDVTVDTDIGGTYDDATDSLEALSESLAGATVYATGSTPNTDADLYIRRGDTVAVTIGDLTGLAAGWDVLWVTIKKSVADDDSEAILQVRLNTATPALPGLIYINGQTPTDAGCAATDAWISDVDAGADTLVLNIKPAASLLLPAMGSLWFDVQQLDGTTITSLTTGERSAEIGGDVTRATS